MMCAFSFLRRKNEIFFRYKDKKFTIFVNPKLASLTYECRSPIEGVRGTFHRKTSCLVFHKISTIIVDRFSTKFPQYLDKNGTKPKVFYT